MSKTKTQQILLKLPDPLVKKIDMRVKRGAYRSRQELIYEILRGQFPQEVEE